MIKTFNKNISFDLETLADGKPVAAMIIDGEVVHFNSTSGLKIAEFIKHLSEELQELEGSDDAPVVSHDEFKELLKNAPEETEEKTTVTFNSRVWTIDNFAIKDFISEYGDNAYFGGIDDYNYLFRQQLVSMKI